MDVKYSESEISNEIIGLVSSAFSSTTDASLEEWISFDEMKNMIKQKRGVCFIARDESDKLMGMIYAQQENPVNSREGIEKWVIIVEAVHPDSRGKGIGSGLLKAIEDYAREKEVKKMFVFTNKDDNKVINFYNKNGYEDAGWIKDYQYGKDNSAVFLLKYL